VAQLGSVGQERWNNAKVLLVDEDVQACADDARIFGESAAE
jgi:hypothetical protein